MDIIATRDDRKNKVYAALHTQMLRADKHFEQVFDVTLPKIDGMELKRTKAMREKVMAGVQVYMSRTPRSEVDPRKPTDKGTKQAGSLETLYNYILWQHRPLFRNLYQKLLLRGMAVGKLWFDDRYYGVDKRKFKKEDHDELAWSALSRFPIRLYSCDALNCLPSRAMQTFYQPVDMIEDYTMSMGEALYLVKQNGWKWKPKDSDAEDVRFTCYYDNEYRCVMLDDDRVWDGENVLGFVPYVVIPSGLGKEHHEGKPEYLYRDIIYQDMEMNELQALITSYLHYGFRKNALPQTYFQAEDTDTARAALQGFSEAPDKAPVLPKDIERKVQEVTPINPGIFTFLSLVQSQSGVPATLLGLPSQNTYSEVHYSTQAAYARAQYEIALDNLEMGVAELLGMSARVLEFLDNPISIRNVNPGETSKNIETIRPSDIDGYYECKVKFIGDTPESRQTREQQGLIIHRQQMMPYIDIMTNYFDVPRAEAERMEEDLILEKIDQLAPVMLSRAMEVAEARGEDRTLLLLAAEMASQGIPLPQWAQEKLQGVMPQMPNKPRGGDHRQGPIQSAASMVPLHAEQNVQGLNPREVVANEAL